MPAFGKTFSLDIILTGAGEGGINLIWYRYKNIVVMAGVYNAYPDANIFSPTVDSVLPSQNLKEKKIKLYSGLPIEFKNTKTKKYL